MAGDGGIHGTGREMLRLLCLGMSQCMKSLGKGTYVRVCMLLSAVKIHEYMQDKE